MILLAIGFGLGFFSSFFIVELAIQIVTSFVRRKVVFPKETRKVSMTSNQKSLVDAALHKCVDIGWFNVLFQRFWLELSKSDAHKDRMKRILLKRMSSFVKSKIIEEVDIVNIEIDSEGPIIRSAQLLTPDQVKELIKNRKKELEKEKDEETEKNEIEKMLEEEKFTSKDKKSENFFYENNMNNEDNSFYENFDQEDFYMDTFDKAIFLYDIEYFGGLRTEMVTKVRGFKIPSQIYIGKIHGQLLMKVPAEHYNTRLELCFINCSKPFITTFVHKETYFSNTLSKFMKKFLHYIFKNTFLYPNWFPLRLPLITPSIREINHNLEILTSTNYQDIKKYLITNLKLYMSMDYRVLKNNKEILERVNYYPVNKTGKLYCYQFSLPEKYDSDILYIFKLLEPLKNVWNIKKIQESKIVEGGVYLVTVYFNDTPIEFLRIHAGDILIFQRNDLKNKDFIVFSIKNSEFNIFAFITDQIYKLNFEDIEKIREEIFTIKKISQKEFDSTELKDFFLDIRKNYKDKYENGELSTKKLTLPLKQSEMEKILNKRETRMKLITSTGRVLSENIFITDIDDDSLIDSEKTEDIRIDNDVSSTRNDIKESYSSNYGYDTQNTIILKKGIQIEESGSTMEEEIIKKDLIEYFDWETKEYNSNYGIAKSKLVYRIFTYKEKNLIIDSEFDKLNVVNIYLLKEVEDGTELEIFYTPFLAAINEFTSYLLLKTRIIQCKRVEKNKIVFNCKKKIELETECQGGICLEVSTAQIDDFYLSIYNKTNKSYILNDFKIVTSSNAFFTFGIKENSTLKITLKPKFYTERNVAMGISKLNNIHSQDYIIDCNSSLPTGKKRITSFKAKKGIRVFWDMGYDDDIVSFLEDEDGTKNIIDGYGIVCAAERKYYFYSKNRGIKKRGVKICVGMLPIQL